MGLLWVKLVSAGVLVHGSFGSHDFEPDTIGVQGKGHEVVAVLGEHSAAWFS